MNKKQKERAEIERQLNHVLRGQSERSSRSKGLLDDYRSPKRVVEPETPATLATGTQAVSGTNPVPHTENVSRIENHTRTENVPGTKANSEPVQNVPDIDLVPDTQNVPTKGFLKLSNHFIYDVVLQMKSATDSVVLLYLIARTHGFGQDEVTVALERIGTACGIHRNQARISARRLQSKGYIRILRTESQHPDKTKRGLVIRMLLPKTGTENVRDTSNGPRTKNVHNKEKAFKENNVKGNQPKITPLTPEEKAETIQMIADLITKNGYSFEQAENQFGGNLSPEDWQAIRTKVEERT